MQTIAALFADPRGCYAGLPGVDLWDEARDARLYPGPHPIVGHPPCTRWCQLAGLVEARWGHKRGEDGGCFASALASVRTWGGVLEHSAYSKAWPAHGLAAPPSAGGWVRADDHGGWTCYVEQVNYGHAARKRTWLYAVGTDRPELAWGADGVPTATVSWCANHGGTRRRLGKREASATPPAFRDLLISLARSVYDAP